MQTLHWKPDHELHAVLSSFLSNFHKHFLLVDSWSNHHYHLESQTLHKSHLNHHLELNFQKFSRTFLDFHHHLHPFHNLYLVQHQSLSQYQIKLQLILVLKLFFNCSEHLEYSALSLLNLNTEILCEHTCSGALKGTLQGTRNLRSGQGNSTRNLREEPRCTHE